MATPPLPTPGLDALEAFQCTTIADLTPPDPRVAARGPGRPRILPADALWTGLLVCVLRGFGRHLALWRRLTSGDFWRLPRVASSDQARDQRLARDGTGPREHLCQQRSTVLAARLAPYAATTRAPFATGGGYARDQLGLDQGARLLPALRTPPARSAAVLPGALVGLCDLRRQPWARVRYLADPQQNEQVAARDPVADRPAHSLLLAGLGYFGFRWFAGPAAAARWWVSRLRAKTSSTRSHTHDRRGDTPDALVWLGAHRADRARCAVRLGQCQHRGGRRRYVTNVSDPPVLPPADLARRYARRWDIELAFNRAKTHPVLHPLRGAKPTAVLQQVRAVCTLARVRQALRLELAGRAGVDPFDVSLPPLSA